MDSQAPTDNAIPLRQSGRMQGNPPTELTPSAATRQPPNTVEFSLPAQSAPPESAPLQITTGNTNNRNPDAPCAPYPDIDEYSHPLPAGATKQEQPQT